MTGHEPTGHVDPEIEAQWDRAARALAKWLEPYMLERTRWHIAREFIRSMSEQGFRPPLRPPRRGTPVDHQTARAAASRGADLARRALTRAPEDT